MYLTNVLACAFALMSATATLYPGDRAVLEDLYDSTHGSNWEWNIYTIDIPWNFSSGSDPCTDDWEGVSCMEGIVTRINGISLWYMNMDGTLPSSLQNLTALTYLDLSGNALFGTLPDLQGMAGLRYLDISGNQFTGSVPVESLGGQQDSLMYLSLALNHFTGEIPDHSAFTLLWHLDLSYNELTGMIPNMLVSASLTELSLEWNFLHGLVPELSNIMSVTSLLIAGNFLSGTVPEFVSRLQNLSTLSVASNIFEGNIDHMIDPVLQPFLYSVDIAHNAFTGTLPHWLFTPVVNEVFAGYNCFHGTLPDHICNATELSDLDISCLACHAHCTTRVNSNEAYFIVHHHVHGTLPYCLFQLERLGSLTASNNYFTGSLLSTIAMEPSYLTIDLSYNQLTGDFSDSFRRFMKLSDTGLPPVASIYISHNKLTGGFIPGDNLTIPQFDLSSNRLSGPSVEEEWVKNDNAYAFQFLDGNIFSCKPDRSDLHPRDKAYQRYDCGSDSVAKPLYALLACATVLIVLIASIVISWKRNNAESAVTAMVREWVNAVLGDDSQQEQELPEMRRVMNVMKKLTTVAVSSALTAVIALAPLFATLTAYYGTHKYEYAWTVSSVLLAGRLPFALCFAAFISVIGLTARQLMGISPPDVPGRPAQGISAVRKIRCVIACTIYLAINFAVVGAVNVAFVAIETYATPEYQIAISVFKVTWNLTVAPFLSRYLAYELSAARADWIVLELFVSVVCNIGIPLLAIVVVSPRCLFGLVGSQLSILYSRETYDSLMWYESRPFHYSYQCSFQYVNNYVAAFEYMCLMTSFAAPLTAVLIGFLLQRTRPGSCLHNILTGLLPRVLRPVATEPASVPKHSILNSFFDCTQFFVAQFTNLTMICTVGLVFPPLAATAAVAMVIACGFVVLSLGRVMTIARAAGVGAQYAQLIEDDCARVANPVTMRYAVWLLLSFCGVFYPIFLFDTLGDAVGVYESYWVLVAVPLLPFVIVFVMWAWSRDILYHDQQKDYGAELQLADLYLSQDLVVEVSGEEGEGLVDALRMAKRVCDKDDVESGAVVGEACELAPQIDENVVAVEN